MKDFIFVANHNGGILFMKNEGMIHDDFDNNKITINNLFDFFTEDSKKTVKRVIGLANAEQKKTLDPFTVEISFNNSCYNASLKLELLYGGDSLMMIAGYFHCLDSDNLSDQYYKELYLDFIDNLPLGVYRTGAKGSIHYVNKKFIDILGFDTADELYKQNIEDYFVEKDSRKQMLKNWTDDKMQSMELQIYNKNGEVIWVKDSGRAIRDPDGNILFLDGILEDITVQKENELKLKELNTSKDKLFSIISHDLRTPFNQFIGATELLLTKLEEYDKVMIRKFLELLNKEAVQSYRLLENLLQWSKNQRGLISFTPEPIHLIDMIKELMLIYEPMAVSKKIETELEMPGDIYVYADKNMLSTILRNLLSNAVKFTSSGGKITVSAVEKVDEENMFNEYLEICVTDTGVGIPSESIPALFSIDSDSVVKAEYTESGTGLGLVLCKEFVEKHNGDIWVESEPGKGSSFYFTIK